MKILILGDIYGASGLHAAQVSIPLMREQLSPDLVIVNAENVSEGGKSLSWEDYERLMLAGVDYITMGNHTFKHEDIAEILETKENIVRPANWDGDVPGKGYIVFEKNGKKILLMNLLGDVFMFAPHKNPFKVADEILDSEEYDLAIVDFHAEATSEKIVLADYLSDRVGVFYGTHTHVQTADERILNGTTAYITDVGMVGVEDSAIGANMKEVQAKLSGQDKRAKFVEAKGQATVHGIFVELYGNTLKPFNISRIKVKA